MKTAFRFEKYQLIKPLIILCSGFVILIVINQTSAARDILHVGHFSASAPGVLIPEQWEAMTFAKISRHTQYTITEDNHTPVIKAESDRSASGLIRKIRINPEQFPVIKWRWKITNIYQRGEITEKSGDDFPASIYITFEYNAENANLFERIKFNAARLIYGEYPPAAAITYIWASKTPVGTVTANPYTQNVRMFVIQSGPQKLNTWIDEKRNVYEDYIRAFEKKPPMISGIAIMTDSDNTGEHAVSYYGDIIMDSE